ncbi:MAG TPA: RNA methyltransferase [Acidobacteriaceae bacterium]|jgi:TrmH family RNA methyltransferase|nr:RNA methyltransferase [Acidobacteriaceae bacterium]
MPTASDRSRLISIVQSRQNARVRELRAAFSRAARDSTEAIGLEGQYLLAEAIRSGVRLRSVFLRRDPASADSSRPSSSLRLLDHLQLPAAVPIVELTPAVFDSAVDTESPQGIAALIEPPRFSFAEALSGPAPLLIVTAALQDPGNFGTLVRSAEAFGATGILALPGTVSVWNQKTLRASAGSAFRLPVIYEKSSLAFAALAERQIPVLAAVPAATCPDAIPCSRANLRGPAAILIGNEGSGLSPDLLEHARIRVTIPMPGPVESLNAAIAAAILLYEAARQRSAR